ncbi:MAG: D-alanine--D-alanine ligase [Rhodospirillaceae bacterium]
MTMKLGLVYDLRDDYLALGYSGEATAEFDSRETIEALEDALQRLGWDVVRVGRGVELARRLAAGDRFDLVFSIAEGLKGRSREAQVPALCELFDQPYAFSDPLTMSVTLDKAVAKRIVRDHGIPTAPFVVMHSGKDSVADAVFPAFVKPMAEGTGKGCTRTSMVHSQKELQSQASRLIAEFKQPVIAEAYLPGREFTVGIIGTDASARIIAIMEIAISNHADDSIYSYEIKEDWEPYVDLSLVGDPEAKVAGERALQAYQALQCRDAGRVDMRSDALGSPQFLELNPIAGLHPTHSDLPILTTKVGLDYDWLIAEIVSAACRRYDLQPPHRSAEAA